MRNRRSGPTVKKARELSLGFDCEEGELGKAAMLCAGEKVFF